jgi:hypothetical protein
MASLHSTLSQFITTYVQTKSEHPKQHTELEFRIGKVNANNGFDAGYVIPEFKADDTLVDPEKVQREVRTFSRLRETLEKHAKEYPTRWSIKEYPETIRSYHGNNIRQSYTQNPQEHVIERKDVSKQLLLRSNGMLQVRCAISIEERLKFPNASQEAIALKQNKPIAICILERKSFTEVVDNPIWGTVTFRYDLTKVTPRRATKDKCCASHAQYHGELELVEYKDITKSPDHLSYLLELILLRLRFLLGNCIVDQDNPSIQTPLPPPILYCE